ncbi:MAG: hypothetical protein ACLQI7_13230, partial [Streptosporangiaceae bacterium]
VGAVGHSDDRRRNGGTIVDTWWQTETGAIMISPLPGITAAKPGSATARCPACPPRWWTRKAARSRRAAACWC